MILRSMVCDAIVNYFQSNDWQELIRQMSRGKEVRHAHAYADSILHPEPLLRIVEGSFKAQGMPLQRKIYLIPPGNTSGMADIYNIHPNPDWGHCELILRFNQDQVLAPMATSSTPTGKSVEVWDDTYMEQYYARFDFKTALSTQDEKDIKAYFDSPEWKLQYNFMLGGTNRHTHSLVETTIHPEIIQEFAVKAIESRGWEVSKSVSVVYGMRGQDFGKITTLVKRPEIMLELEWAYNPNVSIKAGAEPMILATTLEDLHQCMSGYDYIRLDDQAVSEIIERLRSKA
jgi:hypothetical protein